MLLLVYVALAILSWSSTRMLYYGLVANMGLFVGCAYLMTLLYPPLYGLTAWLLGGRVFHLVWGRGARRWERFVGHVLITIKRYPVSGRCVTGFFPHGHEKAGKSRRIMERLSLVTLSGPLLSLLILALLLPQARPRRWMEGYAPREALALASGLVVAFMLPRRRMGLGEEEATVGDETGRLITVRPQGEPVEMVGRRYFFHAAQYALIKGEPERALRACEEGLALYPDSLALKNAQAVALSALGRYGEARGLLEEGLAALAEGSEDGVADKVRRAILLSNLADVMLQDKPQEEALAQARQWTWEAYRMAPWYPAVQETWEAVLNHKGDQGAQSVFLQGFRASV